MGKLQRMRESVSLPSSWYQRVSEEEMPQSFKESTAYKNLKLGKFEESSSVNGAIKLALRMKESAQTMNEKADFDKIIKKLKEEGANTEHKLWKFPVSRFGNVNANGRIYPRELWENVIDNQRDTWCGSCGLADHPMDDADPGQFKTSSIVWLDMMIDDANKLIWAIGSFVGEYGRLAQEIIEAGGRVGFSSSGFGETMMDGKTVNPETYVIERTADIVTSPSQSVFGDLSNESFGNVEYTKQGKIGESFQPKSAIIKENNMRYNAVLNENDQQAAAQPQAAQPQQAQAQQVPEEQKNQEQPQSQVAQATQGQQPVQESKFTKLEKKCLRKQIEAMIEDANLSENPAEKLKEVNELLDSVEDSEDPELIKEVEGKLVAVHNELMGLVESATDIKKQFGDLDTMAENTKKVLMQGKLLGEQIQDYKKICEALSIRNRKLSKEVNVLQAKIALKESKETAKRKLDRRSEAEKSELLENNKKMSLRNRELKETIDRLNKANRQLESKAIDAQQRLKKSFSKISELKEALQVKEEKERRLNEKVQRAISENKEFRGQINRLQNRYQEAKHTAEDLLQEKKELSNFKFNPRKESNVSKYLNLKEEKGLLVENYWNELLRTYGEAVKPYERQIRGKKTYREAFNEFLKLKSLIDNSAHQAEVATIDESISSRKERAHILKEAGMKTSVDSFDEINAMELENMKKMGLV